LEGSVATRRRGARTLRWTARVWSVASVALLLAFIVGERSHPTGASEWLEFLFFPVGISVGMILAWWKEALGGSITVGSLLAFYAAQLTIAGTFPKGWAWLAFAAPGFLFLVASHVSRKPSSRSADPSC
jgi:hypothetical protein